MLDPAAFEDVEADRYSAFQAAIVVAAACAAGCVAVLNAKAFEPQQAFVIGLSAAVGTWLVWSMLISTIGTHWMPEPQTRSNPSELFRTIGFAAAPGVFYGFASMPTVGPLIITVVSVWMIAATVIAVRQALDYRSTARAIAVCVTAWLIAMGMTFVVAMLFTTSVT